MSFIALLVLGVFALCGAVMLVMFLTGGLFFVRKLRRDVSTAGHSQSLDEGIRWLDQQAIELALWQPTSITDLSNQHHSTSTDAAHDHARGVVNSIAHNKPLIAFYALYGPNMRCVLARTSEQAWRFDVLGDMLHITCDATKLGALHLEDGVLFDAHGASIGRADLRRSVGAVNDRWADLTLRDQIVGAIQVQRGAKHMQRLPIPQAPEPLVKPAALPLDQESEQWLLALTIFTVSRGYVYV